MSSAMICMELFCGPQAGAVDWVGVDISTRNVLCQGPQITYVREMPTLFQASICDSIAYGAPVRYANGAMSREEVSDEQIAQAAAGPWEGPEIIATHSVAEPSTQIVLNTFHHVGSKSKHVS